MMMMALLAVGLIVVMIVGSVFLYQPPLQRYEKKRDMMGTYVRIVVYHHDEDDAMGAIDSAFTMIEEVNSVASRYNSSSELYRLNTEGQIDNASPELKELITKSIYYNGITKGAFDITITPLLDLWGDELKLMEIGTTHSSDLDDQIFTESLRTEFQNIDPPIYGLNETPIVTITSAGWTVSSSWQDYYIVDQDDELSVSTNFWFLPYDTQEHYINMTKNYVGTHKITIQGSSIEIEEGMSLTLDGIAKGYAVDKAIEELENKGIESAFVDAGGDIATLGKKPEGEEWVIGLRNPEDESESIMEFGLAGEAIATSGNYERYFDPEANVGHIMDPTTGRSAFRSSSATIIAKNCTSADVLATATFVLGPEAGTTLINTLQQTESLILAYDDPESLTESDDLEYYTIEG